MTRRRRHTEIGKEPWQSLPSVAILLDEPRIRKLAEDPSRPVVLDAIGGALGRIRKTLVDGDPAPEISRVVDEVLRGVDEILMDRVRPVINATGILLHTGLGRAVLPQKAVDRMATLNRCCNLQIDLATGLRGKRDHMTEYLLTKLTGAEAAVVVNNNASATLLIMKALCKGKEVLVSRGQLIEIGGSYRLQDCVHESGAILVEVGTTNKTHLRDYESALTDNTAAILRVNPSNYRIVGFSEEVPVADLAQIKKKRPILVIDDLGCGALVDMEPFGLPHEPTVPESVASGADVVCFSGDKLIGGPQAGIIVGKKELIDRIRKHPLTRMLRVGKLTDVALQATLELFLHPETLLENHPTLRMAAIPVERLRRRAGRLKRRIERSSGRLFVRVVKSESAVGGGSMPAVAIETSALALRAKGIPAEKLSGLLRRNTPPIIARIKEDDVILDMRTLLDGEEPMLLEALEKVHRMEPTKS